MSFCRALFVVLTVVVFTGCSDPDNAPSVPAPAAAPAPSAANVALAVPTSTPAVSLPGVPSDVASTKRDTTVPIVQGSADDPNVLPAGFVPKPPALQYVLNGQPNLEALSQALQVYCMWKKAVPAEMEELVSSKYMASLPPLPAGKKYSINAGNLSVGISN